jgi:hypothetical protein
MAHLSTVYLIRQSVNHGLTHIMMNLGKMCCKICEKKLSFKNIFNSFSGIQKRPFADLISWPKAFSILNYKHI